MRGPFRCVVFAGLLGGWLAGCGDDSSLPTGDAATGGGLVVTWSSQPTTWPGDLGDGLSIDIAEFAFDNVRVVGDAAAGDPRTQASSFTLRWDDATKPPDLAFPDAPGGLYSQLSLLIDGHVAGPSIELLGHVTVNATVYEFRITDDSPFPLTLPIAMRLTPPAKGTLAVSIDFDHALSTIDFAAVDNNGGRLELDNSDPQITAFRAKLMEAVTVIDGSPRLDN